MEAMKRGGLNLYVTGKERIMINELKALLHAESTKAAVMLAVKRAHQEETLRVDSGFEAHRDLFVSVMAGVCGKVKKEERK